MGPCVAHENDFRNSRLKKVKEVRIVLILAAVAAGLCVASLPSRPIQAAQQNAGLNKETAPMADTQPPQDPGAASYAKHCAICHGDQREGILPGFPPLQGINHRMAENKIADLVHTGKGRMPGFPNLQDGELTALLHYLTNAEPASATGEKGEASSGLAEAGGALFHQNCAFCHGRDAMGGETGPDLTQSKLVLSDTTGEKIAAVVREGKPDNKMPGFNFSSQEIKSLIAFIHFREAEAKAHPGGRRGVSVEDLQTGNAQAGKEYFDGAGGCVKCHSPRGDLAGVANRYQGLQLEERMLYPRGAKSTVTVTLPAGQKVTGTLAYRDEFTVALRDSTGTYRSWPTSHVRFTVQSPADAHVELFSKYTDEDIHNLMAYMQTLR
jgi:mono/diheme cytochrome c family protein